MQADSNAWTSSTCWVSGTKTADSDYDGADAIKKRCDASDPTASESRLGLSQTIRESLFSIACVGQISLHIGVDVSFVPVFEALLFIFLFEGVNFWLCSLGVRFARRKHALPSLSESSPGLAAHSTLRLRSRTQSSRYRRDGRERIGPARLPVVSFWQRDTSSRRQRPPQAPLPYRPTGSTSLRQMRRSRRGAGREMQSQLPVETELR